MLAVLLLIQRTVYRVLSLPRDYFLLSFLPSCFLLLYVTQLDYNIYVLKSGDVFYSQMLGFLFALLPLAVRKLIAKKPNVLHYGLMLIYLVVGYPLAGFYALLGILYLLIYHVSHLNLKGSKSKTVPVFIITGLVLLLSVPQIYSFFYTNINPVYLYAYGLPVNDFYGSGSMYLPLLSAWLSFGLFLVFLSKPLKELKTLAFSGVFALLLLSMSVVWVFTNKDKNLEAKLAIENAISRDDWNKVLSLSTSGNNQNPDRIMIMYRNLALWKKNPSVRLCFCILRRCSFTDRQQVCQSNPYSCSNCDALLRHGQLLLSLEYGKCR